jgi:acyl-CoA synthetase (AMP-forming)/AMP-acid ligase II
MISHRNVIANVLQITAYDTESRTTLNVDTQVTLGLLPFSHIYALVVVTHTGTYRGDEVVVLPKFDLKTFLSAIQTYKIAQICVVSQPFFLVVGTIPTVQ